MIGSKPSTKATTRGRVGADRGDTGHGVLRGGTGVGKGTGRGWWPLLELPDHLLHGPTQLGVMVELQETHNEFPHQCISRAKDLKPSHSNTYLDPEIQLVSYTGKLPKMGGELRKKSEWSKDNHSCICVLYVNEGTCEGACIVNALR